MNSLAAHFISDFDIRISGFPLSQHARFLETEVTGIPFPGRADDDVIEQFDLQKLRGLGQTSRETVVRLTRRCIAGRMIVHDDDGMS